MSLYRGSVRSTHDALNAGRLVDHLDEAFRHGLGYRASASERRSWERSLPVLTDTLLEAGLSEIEVLLEHRLPYASARADVVLCGTHPRTHGDSYVVVELKQWTRAWPVDGTDDVVVDAAGTQARLHPVAQVSRYCEYLADYVAVLDDPTVRLNGVAYLHNAHDADVDGLFDMAPSERGQLFTTDRRSALVDHLRRQLAPAPGVEAADRLLGSVIRPGKQLLQLAAQEVQDREQFVLLDEQQVAFSKVKRALDRARQSNTKTVVIITGGPGSGKSVIALSLLGDLARQGRSVLHATGSSAFTQTMRKVAGKRSPRVQKLFTYYNQFISSERNELDVLINDEAHRLKETSTNRYTKRDMRTGRPQVEELIDVAWVPVFLLDEHQVVRPHEVGTVKEIADAAERLGCLVETVSLDDQFRSGGSRAYEEWVLRLLELTPGGPIPWIPDGAFEVTIADTPTELESRLRSHLTGASGTARIAAGYCWDWSKPSPDGLVPDIQIGDWHRPWNNPKDTAVKGAPGRPFWASDPAGFDQVGCIYTAQGFEYDYSGVIIGPDLVWRTDRWVARREYSRDNQVRKADPEQFDLAIRNTYKVLLTRGMRGSSLYSTDPETQNFLRELIGSY